MELNETSQKVKRRGRRKKSSEPSELKEKAEEELEQGGTKKTEGEKVEESLPSVIEERRSAELEVEIRNKGTEVERGQQRKQPVVVITGACGFIGSYAVELAKQEGWKVRACDVPTAFRGKDEFGRSRYPEFVKNIADEIVEVDITKPETLRGLFDDVDYVFHIAAILKYDVPWEVLYNVNVLGTKNIFEEILRSKNSSLKRVVVWSTNGVYGVPKDAGAVITEDSPVRPVTRYALSKFLEEKVSMLYYRRYGVPVTIIKPTVVYGPRESYMIYDYLRTINRLRFVAVFSSFDFAFPSVHAVDVVRAAIHLSKLDSANGEDYIVDDDSRNTAIDVMQAIANALGKPFYLLPPIPVGLVRVGVISISYFFKFLSDYLGVRKPLEEEFTLMFGYNMRYSNQKLKSTGFKFRYPKFQDGLEETIKWYREVGLL